MATTSGRLPNRSKLTPSVYTFTSSYSTSSLSRNCQSSKESAYSRLSREKAQRERDALTAQYDYRPRATTDLSLTFDQPKSKPSTYLSGSRAISCARPGGASLFSSSTTRPSYEVENAVGVRDAPSVTNPVASNANADTPPASAASANNISYSALEHDIELLVPDTSISRRRSSLASSDVSRSISEKRGLNGLKNIGNTCFMNSVLQCLSNTRPLLEYLLDNKFESDINTTTSSMKGALIKAFADLIKELWARGVEDQVVATSAFKNQIQRFAPRFMGYLQQDAQEFLRYLLEGLHEDVNKVLTRPKAITSDIDDNLTDNEKATEAWRRYTRMEESKIMDIFVGQLKSTLQCTKCGHCSVTFDPFWDLSLPLPSRVTSLKLQACLDMFAKEEVLDGDEKPTCSKCQSRQKCTKKLSIHKFPKILVLHLKRFSPTERFRGKLSNTVEFPLTGLDMSGYAATRGVPSNYSLYAVSNHAGTTYSGHYTAYCRHPYTQQWHEYNDSRVRDLSQANIVSGEAYVLFYEMTSQSSHL